MIDREKTKDIGEDDSSFKECSKVIVIFGWESGEDKDGCFANYFPSCCTCQRKIALEPNWTWMVSML